MPSVPSTYWHSLAAFHMDVTTGVMVVVVQPQGLEVGLEMLRSLYRVVARQVREEVVADVRAADVVVHPVEEAEEP